MLIHQAAFAGPEPLLKGELHCHTTRSDAKSSPETVIRQYAAMGFDFLALTDHRRYNYENVAPETGLMILPGMELDANMDEPIHHCVHIVSLGPEKEKGNGFEQDQRFESLHVPTAADSLPLVRAIQEANNLPIFCHPEWSGNSAQEILSLPDIHLMEIWNSGCVVENGLDSRAAYWDEVLFSGREMYGVATDDGHQLYQNGLGYVKVRAEKNPSAILDALRRGAFYASCGPEIYDFYLEDDKAVILCSPVDVIRFRHFRVPYRECTGPGIMGHQIVPVKGSNYIRAEIQDSQGRMAWTNPIFLSEEHWKRLENK
jgi:hypothetical protein